MGYLSNFRKDLQTAKREKAAQINGKNLKGLLKKFKEGIANSQIEIIPDAGHAPFAEKPDQVCKILRNFLT